MRDLRLAVNQAVADSAAGKIDDATFVNLLLALIVVKGGREDVRPLVQAVPVVLETSTVRPFVGRQWAGAVRPRLAVGGGR